MPESAVDFTGLCNPYADRLGVLATPSTIDLVKEYRGLSGACSNFNANAVANTELKLLSGETEVKTHPFLDLWKNPNPYMAGPQFVKMTQLYLELAGKVYWRIIPGDITPISQLLILPPHQVEPRIENKKQIGWRWQLIDLSLEEVVPFYCADPLNPYGDGCGPTEVAWEFLTLFHEDAATMLALLRKRGRPGALISPEGLVGVIAPALGERLKAWWNSFTGRHSGDVAVSPVPLKVDLLNVNSRDYQGSERAQMLKTLIMNCYDIPPALFDSMKSRAELEAALLQYGRNAIDPRTTLLAGIITNKVVKLFDESLRVEFAYASLEDEAQDPEAPTTPRVETDNANE